MKTIEYRSRDKSQWERGPWDAEPDKRQWTGRAGLPCLIVRGPSGALCGYVGVQSTHPAFAVGYDGVDVQAHGGLTYSDFCQPKSERTGICHKPGPGEPDHVWWLGFDCAHSGDFCPSYDKPWRDRGEYRDLAYVEAECESLAEQLAAYPIAGSA